MNKSEYKTTCAVFRWSNKTSPRGKLSYLYFKDPFEGFFVYDEKNEKYIPTKDVFLMEI